MREAYRLWLAILGGAFVTSARGIAPVAEIDGTTLPVDADQMTRLRTAYESAGWDRI